MQKNKKKSKCFLEFYILICVVCECKKNSCINNLHGIIMWYKSRAKILKIILGILVLIKYEEDQTNIRKGNKINIDSWLTPNMVSEIYGL